ncbi:unnamed protein product [Orchesella dallaii]|uniref:PPM-type phosphatase domain-containing protein n=1 Tax=Orchesella dallaii TaxID=48710 RepID=A0ABP1S8A6_9HEXA
MNLNLAPYYNTKLGAEIRVTGHSHQGQTKRQEDAIDVAFQTQSDNPGDSLFAFFGVFDGHGGPEAALYVKKQLMSHITAQSNFWSGNDSRILKAIRDGFLSVQEAMWLERRKQALSSPSSSHRLRKHPSYPGTTATIAILKEAKLYIGHVGNSGIVFGYQEPGSHFWRAKQVTEEHIPDKVSERERMHRSGLAVRSMLGLPRVVSLEDVRGASSRRKANEDDFFTSSGPFLPLARSLGDLWSYSREKEDFLVSPVPDTFVVEVDSTFRCMILATDGLWDVVSDQDAVDTVFHAERSNKIHKNERWANPSRKLVKQALREWESRRLRADNTSVVTVVFDKVRTDGGHQDDKKLHRVSSKEEIMEQYWKALGTLFVIMAPILIAFKMFEA